MIEKPRPQEKNIIRDTRNRFRLEKETKAIKDKLKDIKNFFEVEEQENYYKPVRVCNF